jgi:hypothetical protein
MLNSTLRASKENGKLSYMGISHISHVTNRDKASAPDISSIFPGLMTFGRKEGRKYIHGMVSDHTKSHKGSGYQARWCPCGRTPPSGFPHLALSLLLLYMKPRRETWGQTWARKKGSGERETVLEDAGLKELHSKQGSNRLAIRKVPQSLSQHMLSPEDL